MNVLPVYKNSFFCGPTRIDGVGQTLTYEDGLVRCDLFVDRRFEGYAGVVHGGVVTGILDTMMWFSILLETGKVCMTRNINMDFHKPVLCNTRYKATSRFERIEEKDVFASAWIEDDAGEAYTKIAGLFREGKDVPIRSIIDRFDFSKTGPDLKARFLSLADGK